MTDLQNKVAIITGATSGMGLSTAQLFLEKGAKVVLTGRSQEKLDALQGHLQGEYLLVRADAASTSDSRSLLQQTVAHFGKVDILFLNAGIFKALPVGQLDEAIFDDIYNINVKGPLFLVNEALPHLNAGASVIFNTSSAGHKGMPGVSIYGSSKAALRSIVRHLAAELSPQGIRVNAISPGPIETEIWGKTNLSEEQLQEFAGGVTQQVPLGRFGQSSEIAQTALFLASAASSYITGGEIAVDGGMAQV